MRFSTSLLAITMALSLSGCFKNPGQACTSCDPEETPTPSGQDTPTPATPTPTQAEAHATPIPSGEFELTTLYDSFSYGSSPDVAAWGGVISPEAGSAFVVDVLVDIWPTAEAYAAGEAPGCVLTEVWTAEEVDDNGGVGGCELCGVFYEVKRKSSEIAGDDCSDSFVDTWRAITSSQQWGLRDVLADEWPEEVSDSAEHEGDGYTGLIYSVVNVPNPDPDYYAPESIFRPLD